MDDETTQEIARLIAEGNTSGILDSEDGVRTVWTLSVEQFTTRDAPCFDCAGICEHKSGLVEIVAKL